MDVILHIGAHRTGTTSLQSYLQAHRAALLAQGCLALGPQVLRKGDFQGLFRHDARRAAVALAQCNLNRDLDRAAEAGLQRLLLSEENLIGHPRKMLASGLLYPDLEPLLRRLGPRMRLRVTRVGLGIRDYAEFWSSLAAFGIHYGVHRPQAGQGDLWCEQCLEGGHGWPDHIATLLRLFPRASVLVWRAEYAAGDPAYVLRHLVRGLHDLPEEAPHLNARRPTAELRAALTAKGALKAAALIEGDHYSPFTPAASARMTARYHDDLARIAGMGGRVRLLARHGGAKDKENRMEGPQPAPTARQGGERDAAIRWQNH